MRLRRKERDEVDKKGRVRLIRKERDEVDKKGKG